MLHRTDSGFHKRLKANVLERYNHNEVFTLADLQELVSNEPDEEEEEEEERGAAMLSF